jgi:uncharacterized protein (DUF169 family)
MPTLAELGTELENILRLKTKIIAYKTLEKAEDLDKIPKVTRIDRFFTMCQVPFIVRTLGSTVGITKSDKIHDRCSRIFGLEPATEKSMQAEANLLSTTWFHSPEDGLKQQADYCRIPVEESIVLAPLTRGTIEPDVIQVFGTPAQIMMILCGLQKIKYERFSFSFIGEGSCSDSVAQCYVTGKPSVAIPCYGARSMGAVSDDEMEIALPPSELERTVSGLKELYKLGLRYPISFIGPLLDPTPTLAMFYPSLFQR